MDIYLPLLFLLVVDLFLAVGLGTTLYKFQDSLARSSLAAVICEVLRQGVVVLLVAGWLAPSVALPLGGLLALVRGLLLWTTVGVMVGSAPRPRWYAALALYALSSALFLVPSMPAAVPLYAGTLVVVSAHLAPCGALARRGALTGASRYLVLGLLLTTSLLYATRAVGSLDSQGLGGPFHYFESLSFACLGIVLGLATLERIGTVLQAAQARTAESERRYHAIVDHSLDAIITVDSQGRIIDWNPQAEAIFGWRRAEILERPLAETIIPPKFRAAYERGRKRYLETGRWSLLDRRFEMLGCRRSGQQFPIEVAVIAIHSEVDVIFSLFMRDITRRKRSQEALRKSEERYRAVSELASDYAYALSFRRSGTVKREWITDAFSRITGFEPEELDRTDGWKELVHPDDQDRVRGRLRKLERGEPDESEYRIITKDGQVRWLRDKSQPVREPGGERVIGIFGAAHDTTEQKRFEEQLRHDALHDELTGLPNRTLFHHRLRSAIDEAKESGRFRYAVLFIDLDGFKWVNDSLGHAAGDGLLIQIASRLEGCLRGRDTMARLSGDEFIILICGIDRVAAAISVAERGQRALSAPFHLGDSEIFITASIGIALSSSEYDDPDEVVRDADTAMYRAKSLGRGRYAVFDREMHDQAVVRLRLDTELRRAVERQEFTLFYQPIVSLKTGRIAGLEALIRWRHPERGLLGPAQFLRQVEASDMMVPVSQIVLREASRQAAAWRESFPQRPELVVSVNVFSQLVSRGSCLEILENLADETQAGTMNLCLEITENVLIETSESLSHTLEKFRDLGIKVYLDDFGTGYSSLAYLQRFPIDGLKIDRSFLAKTGANTEGLEIIKSIIPLGHNLGMNVIAEGVETPEQLAWLRQKGCEYGQGYHFSRPMPKHKAQELIAAHVTFIQGQCAEDRRRTENPEAAPPGDSGPGVEDRPT